MLEIAGSIEIATSHPALAISVSVSRQPTPPVAAVDRLNFTPATLNEVIRAGSLLGLWP
jgi:hypothetical protein